MQVPVRLHFPNQSHLVTTSDADWNCLPNFLEALERVLKSEGIGTPEDSIDHFEYEDDEVDRVAVRTEEDFQSMLSRLEECFSPQRPLHIYPILKEQKVHWRKDGLRVETCANSPRNSLELSLSGSSSLCRILNRSSLKSEMIRHLRVLGNGHCGTVYKSLDVSRDRLMAAKCVCLDLCPELQSRVLTELEVLAKCSSPYIVEFYGSLFVDTQISIFMEYMDGGSLDEYGRIPNDVLIPIGISVILGLAYLWGMQILHRDVKPSNMLINSAGEVKLCDFGVSVQLQRSIARSYVGTNVYMAPERILGKEYRVHSDIWSLAVSLLELALGRFPFGSIQSTTNPLKLMERITAEGCEESVRQALEEAALDDQLSDLLRRCLRRQPLSRLSPEQLQIHPLLKNNTPIQHQTVADWLKQRKEDQ